VRDGPPDAFATRKKRNPDSDIVRGAQNFLREKIWLRHAVPSGWWCNS